MADVCMFHSLVDGPVTCVLVAVPSFGGSELRPFSWALAPRFRKSSLSESGAFGLGDPFLVFQSSSIPWGRSFSTCVCACLALGAFPLRVYMGWVVLG